MSIVKCRGEMVAAVKHGIAVDAPASAIYAALTTADGLRGWNTPGVGGTGEAGTTWKLSYTGRPSFEWSIEQSENDQLVVWRCVAGPGDSVGTDVRFQIEPIEDGRCRVDVVHDGWPGTGGNFTKCNTLWGALVFSLRRFAETSTPAPAFT
jgi:uncharacterized protein YndB with AHSA1/START domain